MSTHPHWNAEQLTEMVELAERLGFPEDVQHWRDRLAEVTLGDQFTTYNGERMRIRDVPSKTIREMLGFGHSGWETREVHPGYPVHPSECAYGSMRWEWINDGENLVCPRCGLDGT